MHDYFKIGKLEWGIAIISLLSLCLQSSIAAPWIMDKKIQAPDLVPGEDSFGLSVAINNGTLIVGSDSDDTVAGVDAGSACVYVKQGTNWTLQAQLFAPDGASFDHFGYAVDILEDTIVVSARYDDTPAGFNSGSVYTFVRQETNWFLESKITAIDADGGDLFGQSVALENGVLAVGAIGNSAVYMYQKIGTNWIHQQKIGYPSYVDNFGLNVDVYSNTLVISGESDWGVYTFQKEYGIWQFKTKISGPIGIGQTDGGFGNPVRIHKDTIVVGARNWTTPQGIGYCGRAYVYSRNEDNWDLSKILEPTNLTENASFGIGVAVYEDLIVATRYIPPGVYFFEKKAGDWVQTGELEFGQWWVSIDNYSVATAAPGSDSAYVFETDSDGDGLFTSDEIIQYHTDPQASDSDRDGMTDGCEIIAGTDPTNVTSLLTMNNVESLGCTNLVIGWSSVSNKSYRFCIKNSLTSGTWSNSIHDILASPPQNSLTVNVSSASTSFFKVEIDRP